MRILLLDDNEDVLESLALVLETAGYETVKASDGDKAVALQEAHPADLLITDIFMPDIDGLETIKAFRARWPRLKIIAISGGGAVAKHDYLTIAGEAGADFIMRKPVRPDELLRTLEGLQLHAG